jgi:hypothetical protein
MAQPEVFNSATRLSLCAIYGLIKEPKRQSHNQSYKQEWTYLTIETVGNELQSGAMVLPRSDGSSSRMKAFSIISATPRCLYKACYGALDVHTLGRGLVEPLPHPSRTLDPWKWRILKHKAGTSANRRPQ